MKTKTVDVLYRQSILLIAVLSLLPAATLWAMTTEEAPPPPRPSIPVLQSSYGKLPLSFEANHGQWDPSVQFVTRGQGHTLFLTPAQAVLNVRTVDVQDQRRVDGTLGHKLMNTPSPSSYSVVRMSFVGADTKLEMVGLEPLPGIANHFIGDDPTKWHTNIPTYQKVGYKDLYPGIDLVYYGNQGHLEYDLVVAPGADPTRITLAFDGAEQIAVDQQGDLVLTLSGPSSEGAGGAASTLRLHKPIVYQEDEEGNKHLLAGSYVLRRGEIAFAHQTIAVDPRETQFVAFQLDSWNASKALIIDPVLSWATYLGGNSEDRGQGIAVDQSGNAYVTGFTISSDFPGTAGSASQSTLGGDYDAFVTKLNAAGTAIVYSTYLGGNSVDEGMGIAVDATGNAYVTGNTSSHNFPGTAGSAIQRKFAGGNLGGGDAFVTKLNAAGTAILYSTYLGGNNPDQGFGIAVDVTGNAYVTGNTQSQNLPGTAGSAIQSTFGGGVHDVFVTKLNAAGTALVYSTYLGGRSSDFGQGIAVDAAGNAYVTGATESDNFPGTASSAIQNTFRSGFDVFVTKLNAAGTAIVYSTYLGNNRADAGFGIAVDTAGNAYVTGNTQSQDFPGTAGSAIQSTIGGDYDAFVTKLNAAGTAILYSTYLGGEGTDQGSGIAVDAAGNAYVAGETSSYNFPGTAASLIQSTFAGGLADAFVTKLNAAGTALVYSTYLGGSTDDIGNKIAVDHAGQVYVTGFTFSSNFPGTAGSLIQSTRGSGFDTFVAKITNASLVNDLVTLVPVPSTYRTTADPTGCPSGFVGKFSFDAWLTNKTSSPPLSDLAVHVKTLTNGNLLQNADGGNGGVGSVLTVPKKNGYTDGILSHGESVDVHFSICLKDHKPFSFFVDVLGTH